MASQIQMEDNVFWVGAIDWSVRNFHGYRTEEGTSYNSYLIMDEHPTVVDSVKITFAEEQVERISKLIEPSKVEYIIVNHAEGDHTGSLPFLVRNLKNAKIVTNKICQGHLLLLYPELSSAKFVLVDGTDTLNIGQRELHFLLVPGVHWPDSMMTFDATNGVLYSNDGFGQHVACSERFADEITDLEHLLHLMQEYMANILGPCKQPLKPVLAAAGKLEIKTILTAHGCSWRGSQISVPIMEYINFVNSVYTNGVLVIFDSLTSQTEHAARCLAEGVFKYTKYVICDLRTSDLTHVALIASLSAGIALGSPTVNGRCTAKMESCIRYLKGLKLLQGKPFCVFGSFGWASKSCNIMQLLLKAEKCVGNVDFRSKMGADDEDKIFSLGESIGRLCKLPNKI